MQDINILGINGSPHKEGGGAKLLDAALRECAIKGTAVRAVHLVDYVKSFHDGSITDHVRPEMKELFSLLSAADGIILSSPVHWFTMSSLTKSFIDHLTVLEMGGFLLEGKVVSFIATCDEDGGQKTCLDMAGPLIHMGCVIPPYATFFHNKNMEGRSEDGWQNNDILLLGANLVAMCRLICDATWGYENL